ncbi:RHS repeat protein, partial [Enterobacter hormaechei]
MAGTADESRTAYGYDGAGRLVERYDAYGTAEQARTRFEYNGLGDLVRTIDPNGHATSYAYD